MPRRNHPSRPQRPVVSELPGRPLAASGERRESYQGLEFVVRSISGAAAVKEYRCPGCDQLVLIGVPHVVAWPADDPEAGNRRHWHTPCWAARDRRTPGVQRGRSAPRY